MRPEKKFNTVRKAESSTTSKHPTENANVLKKLIIFVEEYAFLAAAK
jgi:hypothetical protein